MSTIIVRHSTGSYPVLIESGLAARLPKLVERFAPGRIPIMITDRTVARVVPTGWSGRRLVVPPGEGSKSVAQWSRLIDQLIGAGLGRQSVVVAMGGGMIGDLAGFAAAAYLRGVPVIQVPTTLLAMVDASVGGKTGINTARGKNLIGAFHPPLAVLIDPSVTETQRIADFRAGLVEALKHGWVADPSYYRWITRSAARLLDREPAALGRLIRQSVAIKAAIVSADEREDGRRAVLNAGHTVGHALEQASGYRSSHGDAVGLGLVVEAVLASRLGLAPADRADRLIGHLRSLGIPLRFPTAISDSRLTTLMRRDKKNRDGAVHFALVESAGRVVRRRGSWTIGCPEKVVIGALAEARKLVVSPLSTRYPHSPSR